MNEESAAIANLTRCIAARLDLVIAAIESGKVNEGLILLRGLRRIMPAPDQNNQAAARARLGADP
jgi:hypothetical protein